MGCRKVFGNCESSTSVPRFSGSYAIYKATTAMDKRVLEAMMPYLTEEYGNPHSRTHQYGWNAEAAVEKARNVLRDSF